MAILLKEGRYRVLTEEQRTSGLTIKESGRNEFISYHQIQQISSDGWSKTRIVDFLDINWRTVDKCLKMSEDEFLAPYEGFVKIKLEKLRSDFS